MNKEITVLTTLAIEINVLDEQASHHAGQAVVYAARCGNKLNEAKALCSHGEFLPWLEANCQVKKSQANKYMRVAAEMPHLLDNSNVHCGGHLPSINQAMELLNAPDEIKDAVNSRLEAGEDVTVKEIRELKAAAERLEKRNLELSVTVKEASELNTAIKEQRDRILEANQTEITHIRSALRNKEQEAQTAKELSELLRKNAKVEAQAEAQKQIQAAQHRIEAIQDEREALQKQLEKTNKEIDKRANDKLTQKLFEMREEERKHQARIDSMKGDIARLRTTLTNLDDLAGDLQSHQECLKSVREELLHIKALVDVMRSETDDVPLEVVREWEQMSHLLVAVGGIIAQWVAGSPVQKLIDPQKGVLW